MTAPGTNRFLNNIFTNLVQGNQGLFLSQKMHWLITKTVWLEQLKNLNRFKTELKFWLEVAFARFVKAEGLQQKILPWGSVVATMEQFYVEINWMLFSGEIKLWFSYSPSQSNHVSPEPPFLEFVSFPHRPSKRNRQPWAWGRVQFYRPQGLLSSVFQNGDEF